ncbi:MAG: Uma2 family endonuclease [Acidobacteriota bacterium]
MGTRATAIRKDLLTLAQKLPPGGLAFLSDVNWDEYESLLNAVDERPAVRLTYDNGRMQIMTLSISHERLGDLFPHIIMALAIECGMNFIGIRSTTLKKQEDEKGAEADDCYYFNDYKLMGRKKKIDLSIDPPPDLAFEVDITSPSLSKFPIYASIGVPELWRYTNGKAYFYRLDDGDYIEIDHSDLFPFFAPDDLFSYLGIGEAEGAVEMINELKEWLKTARGKKQ